MELISDFPLMGMEIDLIVADEKGEILNGDLIIGICALAMKNQNRLPNGKAVITKLSNSGLEESLKAFWHISFIRSEVGDRNVVEMMRKEQAGLGGERSGHIIFP